MIVIYHPSYNISLGPLNWLHPFDGSKFAKIIAQISPLESLQVHAPAAPIGDDAIADFADALLPRLLKKKRYVLRALEVPYIPILPFSIVDHRVLRPMRWAVAGTVDGASRALEGASCWNLGGGYHHASRSAAEGFCIYNDIGIAVSELRNKHKLGQDAQVLIIDVDAHHGNGNAYTFIDDPKVTILDIYNNDIYPKTPFTKERVDVAIPLAHGTGGKHYLERLSAGLARLDACFELAFVVAGSDVLATDPLGGLRLSLEDYVRRDALVLETVRRLGVPAVFLGGGGYSRESVTAVARSLRANAGL